MTDPIMRLLTEGHQAHQAGDLATAESRYSAALSKDPENFHALNLLGMLYVNSGRSTDAIDLLSRALEIDRGNPQTHANLGLACKDAGQAAAAIEHFRESLKRNPDNPDVHNNLGNVLRVVDRPGEAITSYENALRLNRNFAECWSNLAAALNEADRQEHALKAVEQALALNPGLAQAYNNRGDIYLAQARYDDALVEYRKAIELSPKYVSALINMGRTLRDMDRPEEALEILRIALELEPANPDGHLVCGVLREQMGNRDKAAESFQAAIRSTPEMTVAHYYLAQIRGREVTDEEFAAMKALTGREEMNANARMYLAFGLYRALEQRGEYDAAFEHLAEGNRLKAESTPYDDEETHSYIDSILASASETVERLGNTVGFEDSRPVFVLGMPRSGTSLTEQILASHSDVAGAGELSYAYDMAHSIRAMTNEKFPENMRLLSPAQFAQLGKAYLGRHLEANLEARYVVDKTPMNFQYIGLLALALPGAKFVHCHRDPVANCWAIHRMPFDEKQTYAHSLVSLGQYYTRYWNLMNQWQEMFPGRILDVRYEDTVADVETQSRRVLDFLGLEFEDAVLDFYKTKRLVKTPSASQVREPIYTESVAAWKRYERHLQPLIENLKLG